MTPQFNVRIPQTVIDEINELAQNYGSQAKVIIVAVSKLKKEVEIRKLYQTIVDKIDSEKTEEERLAFADRAIAALSTLSDAEQEQIATQEFLQFKKFIDDLVGSTSR